MSLRSLRFDDITYSMKLYLKFVTVTNVRELKRDRLRILNLLAL